MATKDLNIRVGIVLKNFDTQLKAAESKLRAFSDRAAATGRDLSLLVSAPIIGAGAAALRGAVEFDRLTKALEAISGSSEAAQAQLADLRKIEELPGISFEQATKASISLQGLGFSADRARTAILGIGNAIATSGGSQANFEGAIRQISQIQAKGRVLQEDISILLENMPVLGRVLQDTFGGSTAEAIRATGVSGGEFVDILLAKLNELPKVQGGLANAFENVGIAAKFAFASIGQEIDKVFGVTDIFKKLGDAINRVADIFKALDDGTKKNILRLAALAAAIGPVLVIGGRLVGAFSGIFQAFNRVTVAVTPLIARMQGLDTKMILTEAQTKSLQRSVRLLRLAFLGIAASIAILVLVPLIQKWREAGKAIDEAARAAAEAQTALSEALATADKETQGATASIKAYAAIVQDETRSQETRIVALKRLKSEYPGYFDALKEDLTNTNLLAGAVSNLTRNLVASAKARALQSKVQEFADKQVDLEEQLTDAIINQELARSRARKAGIDETVDLIDVRKKLLANDLNRDKLSKAQVKAILDQGLAYEIATLQVDRLTKQIQSAESAQALFASKAAEIDLSVKTPEGALNIGDPADLKAAEAAAKEAGRKQKQINRIYNDALGQLKALDQVTAQFGGGTLAKLEKQATIARRALQDLYSKGVSEQDPRAQKLAEELGRITANIRDVSPLAKLASIDFAEFASKGDKEGAKLVKRIEDIAEKSALLKEPGLELKALSAVFSSAAKTGQTFQEAFAGAFSEQKTAQIAKQTEEIGSYFEKLKAQSQKLTDTLNEESEQKNLDQIKSTLEGLTQLIQPLQSSIETFFTSVFEGGANSFGEFAKSLGQNLKKMIAQLVAAAAAAAVLSFLISAVLPGLGLGNLSGGLTKSLTGSGSTSLITGLLRKLGVPFFAEGGIVTRPTLGVIGEAGPEAVIPLDKLKEFQGEGGELKGEVVIRGADLALILERAQNGRRRARGI